MTTTTSNIGLTKIDTTVEADGSIADDDLDFNISSFLNGNWDKIDAVVATQNSTISTLNTSVTSQGSTVGQLQTTTGALNTTVNDLNLNKASDKDIISLTPSVTTTISTTTTTITSTATLIMDATHTLVPTSACTIVLPKETTTKSRICRLKLTMSSIVTLTFPSTVKWCNNSSPSLTSTTATYVVTFITEDGGASWEGSCSTFGA